MRWNGSERALGYLTCLCTLIAGAACADGLESAATRVRPGMSRAEVAAALGATDQRSRNRFSLFCVHIRNPMDPESRRWQDEQIRKFAAASDARYREYQLFRCVVDVEFDPEQGVVSVVAHRSMSERWFFTPWPVAAVAAGLVTAELARRRRPARPAVA
ncbi:MAG: hypothetical protein U0804_10830 [Gemmataceae bacterium]